MKIQIRFFESFLANGEITIIIYNLFIFSSRTLYKRMKKEVVSKLALSERLTHLIRSCFQPPNFHKSLIDLINELKLIRLMVTNWLIYQLNDAENTMRRHFRLFMLPSPVLLKS